MTAFNPQSKPGSINPSVFQSSSKGKCRLNNVPPRAQLTGGGLDVGLSCPAAQASLAGPTWPWRPASALGSGFHTELPA